MNWISFLKWVMAFMGYRYGGLFGALIGFGLGWFIENLLKNQNGGAGNENTRNTGYSSGSGNAGGTGYSRTTTDSRTIFLNALLELSAAVITADGKIMHSEMELMREFLRQNFGESTMTTCNKRLLAIFEEKKKQSDYQWRQRVAQSCQRMAYMMTEENRLQLLMFLADIAKADGKVDDTEIAVLKQIASDLRVSPQYIDQFLSLGKDNLEDAYKVLGITPDATDDEVRKAYRQMALKHHPDKVSNLGEDVQEAAKRKFQEIGNAKEIIFKARGMK